MERRQFIGAAAALAFTALTPRSATAWDGGGNIPLPARPAVRSNLQLLVTMAMILLIIGSFNQMIASFVRFGQTAHTIYAGLHRQWVAIFRLSELYLATLLVTTALIASLTNTRRRDPAYREAKKISDKNKRLGEQARRHALNYGDMAQSSWQIVDRFNDGTRDAKNWANAQRREANNVRRQHGSSVSRDDRKTYEERARGLADGYDRELNMYRLDMTEHNSRMREISGRLSGLVQRDRDYGRKLNAELKTTHSLTLRLGYSRYDTDEDYREDTLNGLRESGRRTDDLWGMRQANWREITRETRQLDRTFATGRRAANSAANKTQRWGLRVGLSYKF